MPGNVIAGEIRSEQNALGNVILICIEDRNFKPVIDIC